VSLKPPWRQKNPVMEKACQAYHKQTAPAKALEVLDNLKVERDGITLDKEVLATKEAWWKNPPKVTVAMFKQRDFPIAIAQISTRGGELLGMTVAKYMWSKKEKREKLDSLDPLLLSLSQSI